LHSDHERSQDGNGNLLFGLKSASLGALVRAVGLEPTLGEPTRS